MSFFSGSIGRVNFLISYGCFFIVAMSLAYLVSEVDPSFGSLVFLLGIAAIPLVFSLIIKRLHDINLSGWFSLLFLVPVVNLLLFLFLILWPGTSTKSSQRGL